MQLCDLLTEDLLTHLPSVIKFLTLAQLSGAALVHSFRGRSRSAAVVTAFLMAKYQTSLEKSSAVLHSKSPGVSPNAGFLAQLSLWEAMRFKLETDFLRYKMYRLERLSENFRKSKIISKDVIRKVLEPDPIHSSKACWKSSVVYKCKGCRRLLATSDHLIPHLPGQSQDWTRSGPGSCSQSVSITPISWMEESLCRNLSGRLHCPHCRYSSPLTFSALH